ncbi:MAG TPA: prolyl oligopeptidase family serine peptidase, partial [Thermoanaerobaculia bacterium]
VREDFHGSLVADPYRWLESLETPRTREWVHAQNRLSREYLAGLPGRDAIRRRLESLWNYPTTEVPWREGGRLFYLRGDGRSPQPVLYVQSGPDSEPRVVLDPNQISPDGSTAIREFAVSPDGRLLAYWMSRGGADVGETHVRRLAGRGRDADVVRGTLTSVCWTRDARGFFYVRAPEEMPGRAAGAARSGKHVFYHRLGRPQSEDRLIREWDEKTRWAYCMLSDDGRRAILVAEQGTQTELSVLDLADAKRPRVSGSLVRILPDRAAFHTPIDTDGDTLYLRTNLDAPKGRIIALDLSGGSGAVPRTVVPESREVIADAVLAGGRIVVRALADARSRLLLYGLGGQFAGEIALPGIGAVGWPLSGRPASRELFYAFTSFLAPSTIYRYDIANGAGSPFRPARLPFDPGAYETRQVFFASRDGARVPMFLTAAKDLKRDGTHPVLLTGYGGYGANLEPGYQPDVPLWLERGGIYAVANLRGGGEYGDAWHRAGMLERKQNTFDDFIAAAEYLIAEGYTAKERLAIYGHSNGGLLIGAVITQRPDLFAAAVANAGHYDMLRYHRFTAAASWVTEYGSPDDPAAFAYLRAYSPLHNVREGACYPATMLLAADHDDRVVPSH